MSSTGNRRPGDFLFARLVVLERQTRRPWGEQPMPQEWRDEARVTGLT